MSTCPHPKCEVPKVSSMYACKKHWFSLPKKIRDRIWRGYRGDSTLWHEADKEASEHWKQEIDNERPTPGL